jgi:hypothetical protein
MTSKKKLNPYIVVCPKKTALTKTLKKMTLKNKAKLLDKVINYYGLQFESFVWEQIHKLEGKK